VAPLVHADHARTGERFERNLHSGPSYTLQSGELGHGGKSIPGRENAAADRFGDLVSDLLPRGLSPQPLASVATEDPALSRGPNKVVLWSYPIIRNGLIYVIDIRNGLIYVIDIRNGLYILRYTGPHAAEAAGIHFLEGNSNFGDAVRLAGPQQG
jgi:hypothetical protein